MRASELYYEELGGNFDAFMSEYDVVTRGAIVRQYVDQAPSRGTCLEVGCGTGAITEWFHELVDELTVSDISARLAEDVGERFGVAGRAEDATELSFADEKFDLVVSSECVEHTPDPAKAVLEMLRVLKPGGHLVLTTPNRLWLPVVLLAQKLRIRQFQGNEVFLGYGELRDLIVGDGHTVLEQIGCHAFPWQIPLAKRVLPFLDSRATALYPYMINQALFVRKAD